MLEKKAFDFKINSQSLEDMQVGYISQKYAWDNYTLEKYSLEKVQIFWKIQIFGEKIGFWESLEFLKKIWIS